MARGKKGKKKSASNEDGFEPIKPYVNTEDERRFEQELELALKLSKEESFRQPEEPPCQQDIKSKKPTTNGPLGKWNLDTPDIPADSESNGSVEDEFEEVSRKGKKSKRRSQMEEDGVNYSMDTLIGNHEGEEVNRYSLPMSQKQQVLKKSWGAPFPNGSIMENFTPMGDNSKQFGMTDGDKQAPRRELKLADFIPDAAVKPSNPSPSPRIEPLFPNTPLNYSTLVTQLKPQTQQIPSQTQPLSQPQQMPQPQQLLPQQMPPQPHQIPQPQQLLPQQVKHPSKIFPAQNFLNTDPPAQKPSLQIPQPQCQPPKSRINAYNPSFGSQMAPSEPLELERKPLDSNQKVISPPITPIPQLQSPLDTSLNQYSLFNAPSYNQLANAFNSTLLIPELDEPASWTFPSSGSVQTSRLHQYTPLNGVHGSTQILDTASFNSSAFSNSYSPLRPSIQEVSWLNPRKTANAPYQPNMINPVLPPPLVQQKSKFVEEDDPEVARLMKYLLS